MRGAAFSVKAVGIVVYFGTVEIHLLFSGIGSGAWWRITITDGSISLMSAW